MGSNFPNKVYNEETPPPPSVADKFIEHDLQNGISQDPAPIDGEESEEN